MLIAGPLLLVEAAVAAGDGEARDEPLQVPLERAGQRLVEVVEAEDQAPVGRREGAEVGQVRVAAELRVQPRAGAAGEVGRHQVGGAAIEGERRDEHAAVADRDELRHARRRLLHEQLDRIGAMQAAAPTSPWEARGTSARAALPRAARSAGVKCSTRRAVPCRGDVSTPPCPSAAPPAAVPASVTWFSSDAHLDPLARAQPARSRPRTDEVYAGSGSASGVGRASRITMLTAATQSGKSSTTKRKNDTLKSITTAIA